MKSLWTTLILFILLLSGILLNHWFIDDLTDQMEEHLAALPSVQSPNCTKQVDALCELWESKIDLVALSVPFPTLDRVSEEIAVLKACVACGDQYGFSSAHALLEDALGDLRRCERGFPQCLL